jgi:DNA-binding NtrC family response regulator
VTPLALEEVSTVAITAPVQLLIVEHSIDDVELILMELKKAGVQIQHTTVEDTEQFRVALANQTFDAVLSDYRLPTWSGMDVLRALRGTDKNTPFLLVTGTLGEAGAEI